MNGRIVRITKLVQDDGTCYMATETAKVEDVQARPVGGTDGAVNYEVTFTDEEGCVKGFYAAMRTNVKEVLAK